MSYTTLHLTDDKLLRRIQEGDGAAFEALYGRYGTDLFNYLIHLTGQTAVAEELLQETWLAVWRQAGEFRGEAQVKSWLLRIAHNQAISWRRRQKPDEPLEEMVSFPAVEDTEETALRQIADDQLVALLDELSTDQRAAIELIFFHQLSYEEAAVVLDCPSGTVKSRVAYARRRLQALLIGGETMDDGLSPIVYRPSSIVYRQFQPILNFLHPYCDYLYMNGKSFVDDDDNRPLADGLAELLPLYAANQLAPEQRAQVDAWLAADPAAQAELALWRQLQRGLLHRPAVSAPPDLARMILAQELPAYASTKGRSVGRQPAPSGWRRWGWRVALQGTFSLIALLLLWVVVQPGLALEWTVAGGQPEAFRVYRAPLDGGAPTLLREIPAQADAAAYRYVDYKALPGQAYRYQVEAVNGHLVQSEWMVGRGWELLPYQLALLLVSLAAGYSLAAFIQIAAAHWRLRQGLTMSL